MPPRKRSKKTDPKGDEDRVGALPDEILHYLLSFLPARDAVQTCVLAQRWRDLWKSATGLRIGGDDDDETTAVQGMRDFVDHLLLLRGCTPLDMCELKLWFDDEDLHGTTDAFRRVNLWIRHAVASRVRTLVIDNIVWRGMQVDDVPLVSQHLTRLELVRVELTNRFCHLSSCSALEYLKIDECNVYCPNIISLAGSLQSLIITQCSFYNGLRTRICVPSLVSLQLEDNLAMTPVLESMPSLVEATVTISSACSDYCRKDGSGYCGLEDCSYCSPVNDKKDCFLLNGLSEAKNLVLTAKYSTEPKHRVEMKGSFCPMKRPTEMLEHLKIVEVKCEVVNENVSQVLKLLCAFNIRMVNKQFSSARHPFDEMAPMRGGRKKARVESGVDGGDRISDLPDEVLHRVLWFLPTHEAVQTSLLSSRWLDLWKSTRRLSIAGLSRSPCFESAIDEESSAVVDKLSKFVNHLLLSRNQGSLHECRFSFDGFEDVNGAQVDMWIRYVLEHVWQLRVLLIDPGTSVHVKFAGRPLVSEHLVRLELSEAKLNGGFLDFSCCPVLLYLKMHACVIGVDKIFSQSLKCLKIITCNFNSASRTEISVSSLLYLELNCCEGQTPLLQTMPSSIRAFVRLGWFDEDHYGQGICGECYGPCENSCDNDNCSQNNSGGNDSENCSEKNSCDSDNCTDSNSSDSGNCAIKDNYNALICLCANCRDNDNISGTCLLLGGLSSATDLRLGLSHHMHTPVLRKLTLNLCKSRSSTAGSEDPFSNLPDEVLQRVLSFLPSRKAVQTCVLSRRWRHQWKSVPALRITDGHEYRSAQKLNKFVNSLLRHRGQTILHDCVINSYDHRNGCWCEARRYIQRWVRYAISCQAQVLHVNAISTGRPLMLSSETLISQHLKRVELLGVKFETDHLDFSGCVTLEGLKMDSCVIHAEMIVSESLTCLSMMFCNFNPDDGPESRIRIAMPRLVSLQLANNYGWTPVLGSMPLLATTFVRLGEECDDCRCRNFDGCGSVSCVKCYGKDDMDDSVLLDGLKDASNLELIINPYVTTITKDFRWWPTFSKLKTLLLGIVADFSALVYFLQHSPILEKLLLRLSEKPECKVKEDGSYNQREQLASKHLQVVEIKYYSEEMLQNFLQILRNFDVPSEKISTQRMSSCFLACEYYLLHFS
uniref:F-box domain-containing protein n=1 Tax=Leersia perrieri TaxID=77586 RepID=A0A0D9XQ53_9ORYZ